MSLPEQIAHVFPELASIPAEYLLPEPVHQKEYLINGELRAWDGGRHRVLSPVCIRINGDTVPVEMGSYPLVGEVEAREGLAAAVAAYDNGRGQWPTMSVDQRIHCVEDFTVRMIARKKGVVKLLMWEIGKTYGDSEKEFDRTVEYIYATIDALKDLDCEGSRFKIEQGIIAQIRRAPLGVVLCMGPFNYPLNETFTTLIPAPWSR